MAGFAGLDPNKQYKQASDGKTLLYLRGDGKWVPTTLAAEQQASGAVPAPAGGPPVDPMLEAQKAAAGRTIQLGDAWDAYQTSQLQSEYGYDPSGNIDTSNPYSRAMHAQQLYQRGQQDLTTGFTRNTSDIARQLGITQNSNLINYAAGGHLNSGALKNAQTFAQGNADRTTGRLTEDYNTNTKRSSEDYGYTSNAIKQQLAASLGQILKGKVDRYSQVGADVNTDTLQSILKALGQ